MNEGHTTVLLLEAVAALRVTTGDTVVDATIGGAGHFSALLGALGSSGTLVGIDADEEALARARAASEGSAVRTELVHDNFRNLEHILDARGVSTIDAALFDLGWSSYHLSSGRGFSFRVDEPLVMTYGAPIAGKTAADLVNGASEDGLADLMLSLGEERFARAIARGIVAAREEAPITTTARLAEVISNSVPGWYRARRIHPATKTFQALRIAVNDELGALRDGLSGALRRLSPGGRVAVITFHSLEDRIVKSMFRDAAYEGQGIVVTKKPIVPSAAELTANPRARSAKLRVYEKCSETTCAAVDTTHYAYA